MRHRCRAIGRSLGVFVALLMLAVPAFAQKSRWTYEQVTIGGLDKLSTQVALDRWGNTHLLWAMKDPKRSGLQLFYSNDITGRFGAPYQVSDSGTVIDSAGSTLTPYVARVDSAGAVHVAYLANVLNHLRIYYTDNLRGEFSSPQFVAEQQWYDMAVDSAGIVHLVWLVRAEDRDQIDVYYWTNEFSGGTPSVIASIDCAGGYACRISNPDVEVRKGTLYVAYRAYHGDNATVNLITKQGERVTTSEIQLPAYDRTQIRNGTADMRVKMAIDSFGFVHLAAPHFEPTLKYRLAYGTNATGGFQWTFTDSKSDLPINDFDIVSDGNRRVAMAWNRTSGTSLYDIEVDALGRITPREFVQRLRDVARPAPMADSCFGSRLAFVGDKIVVGNLGSIKTDLARFQVGLYSRTSVRPELSYFLPDAAAPGMSVIVESYAPYRKRGAFGLDGLHRDSVALETIDFADNDRVVIGPTVISWDGRLASTTVFIKPNAAPGPVPLRLRIGTGSSASYSNIDTFFVVAPQHLGDAATGHLSGGGALGSGGPLGVRSKRGVLVVDSLILDSGLFNIDTRDVDSVRFGNQGYLPMTILSLGDVRIGRDAKLSVSARNGDTARLLYGNAGPGGGGGGSGGEMPAGGGFTGGGGPGRRTNLNERVTGASIGTGDSVSGRYAGANGLNGVPGGGTYTNGHIDKNSAASGGGTGHPFGVSGGHGQISSAEPSKRNMGGYGGGSGGGGAFDTQQSVGGGGGANGDFADGGYRDADGENNGGLIVGNTQLVPLAGGGGGGGGGYSAQGFANGGGGGGALLLLAGGNLRLEGGVVADADSGVSSTMLNGSGGGGGGGGSIFLAAKGALSVISGARISVNGGKGGQAGPGGTPGGNGGKGRIRVDGRISGDGAAQVMPTIKYSGPATFDIASVPVADDAMINGNGIPGTTVRVYISPDQPSWSYGMMRETQVASDGSWKVNLGPLGPISPSRRLYVVALQRIDKPSRADFQYEPEWVMSPAGGAILGRPAMGLTMDTLDFGCIRFDSCGTSDLFVTNTGEITSLAVKGTDLGGRNKTAFGVISVPQAIPPATSQPVRMQFCPKDTGRFSATLTLRTNAQPTGEKTVVITGCAITGIVKPKELDIDLGELCVNDCRDVTLHLSNPGAAPLVIRKISGDKSEMEISTTAKLPDTIQPGGSRDIPLRICLKRFTPAGAKLTIENNSIDSLYTDVVVHGVNAGPNVDYPGIIDVGLVDISKGEPCITRTVQLKNLSTIPVKVHLGAPSTGDFTILEPTAQDIVIPGLGVVELTVKFCSDVVGRPLYAALPILLGDAPCSVDTTIKLRGEVSTTAPDLRIVIPDTGSITFVAPVSVGDESPTARITVRNNGTAPDTIATIQGRGLGGTLDAAIEVVTTGITLPMPVPAGEERSFEVRIHPTVAGPVRGEVIASNTRGSWQESVLINGLAVRPGVQTLVTDVDFGQVRVRSASGEKEIEVFNSGDVPVTIIGTDLGGDAIDFQDLTGPFNHVLSPRTSIKLRYRFTPKSEGGKLATLTIQDAGGSNPTVTLRGEGVYEHFETSPSSLSFDCVPLGQAAELPVEFKNTGTYPLTVSSAVVIIGDDAFEVLDAPTIDNPMTIPAGGSHAFMVRFKPKRQSHQGSIQITTSAPESRVVTLSGGLCPELTGIDLGVEDVTGQIGGTVLIPVRVKLSQKVGVPIDYSLTLRYQYDLLAPLDPSRRDARPPVTAGTLSMPGAAMTRKWLGEVVVTGTMRPVESTESQLLIRVPMKVLRGSTFTSPIDIIDASVSLQSSKLSATGGTFTAEVCDTAGTVIISGKYALQQSYPNPSKPSSIIRYEIARREQVTIKLYDADGAMLRVLVDEVEDAGEHEYRLDTSELPAGIYTYELVSGRYRMTRRLVVVN